MNKTRSINRTCSKQNKTQKSHNTTKPPFPIDVVYTWYGEELSENPRLSNNNELKYSLRSVFFNAPWVNKIYILMNKVKRPSWIKETDRIIMVDHSHTFPSNEYLPNTNSNAIETTMANIPGLSEHYIYFNDDFFLGRKTSYTDFFTSSGKALVDKNTLIYKSTLKNKRDNILHIRFPPKTDRIYKHVPIPQLKSIVLDFYKKYAHYIHWIRSTKRRDTPVSPECAKYRLDDFCQQIAYPIAKYMYSKKRAVLHNYNYDYIYMEPIIERQFHEESKSFEYKLNEIHYRKPLFFCINDKIKQPISKKKDILKKLTLFFESYYPKKADFEI